MPSQSHSSFFLIFWKDDFTVKSPLEFSIHHVESHCVVIVGYIFSTMWFTISYETCSLNFSRFQPSSVIKSSTSKSDSSWPPSSIKYKAPCRVQLSCQKLHDPALICHQIRCSISSLISISLLHTCDPPIPLAITGWSFLQYLHKEFVPSLKFHHNFANKAFDTSKRDLKPNPPSLVGYHC